MSGNYRCLFHKTVFHFWIPRVFPFVPGWFFSLCLDWSGNYSNYAEYTIQTFDRLDLKFTNSSVTFSIVMLCYVINSFYFVFEYCKILDLDCLFWSNFKFSFSISFLLVLVSKSFHYPVTILIFAKIVLFTFSSWFLTF